MSETLEVRELFPTPLWIVDFDHETSDRLNRDLLQRIDALTEPRSPLKVGGSWQTDPTLHERPEFDELLKLIRKFAKGALDFLQIEYDDFEITGCWANINPTGGKNSSHTHPNNYLSGVYYVAVPEGSGGIEFTDPRVQASAIMPPSKKWNKFNANNVSVEVKEGRLMLFPAWLNHAVPVNQSDHERVSISFNIMFTRFTETMTSTLWKKGSTPVRAG